MTQKPAFLGVLDGPPPPHGRVRRDFPGKYAYFDSIRPLYPANGMAGARSRAPRSPPWVLCGGAARRGPWRAYPAVSRPVWGVVLEGAFRRLWARQGLKALDFNQLEAMTHDDRP